MRNPKKEEYPWIPNRTQTRMLQMNCGGWKDPISSSCRQKYHLSYNAVMPLVLSKGCVPAMKEGPKGCHPRDMDALNPRKRWESSCRESLQGLVVHSADRQKLKMWRTVLGSRYFLKCSWTLLSLHIKPWAPAAGRGSYLWTTGQCLWDVIIHPKKMKQSLSSPLSSLTAADLSFLPWASAECLHGSTLCSLLLLFPPCLTGRCVVSIGPTSFQWSELKDCFLHSNSFPEIFFTTPLPTSNSLPKCLL